METLNKTEETIFLALGRLKQANLKTLAMYPYPVISETTAKRHLIGLGGVRMSGVGSK